MPGACKIALAVAAVALAVPIGWYLQDTSRGFAALWKLMAPAADASYKQQKRRLFADAGLAGARVLEIGPGTGVNMRHYRAVLDGEPGAELASLTLAEPNEFMHKDLEAAAHEAGFNGDTLRITNESATALAAEDGSYDVVVSTLVLCSVPDPKLAIDEIWRVLAPGGRFVYLEHVHGPPGTWERSMQRVVMATKVWQTFGDGCDVERDTGDWITEKDGWAVDGEIYTSSEGPPFVRSHAVGIATKQRSRL